MPFVNEVLTVVRQLESIKRKPKNDEITDKLLIGLHSLFSAVRTNFSLRTPKPSIKEITAALKEFEDNEIERLSQSSQRTTRSQSRSTHSSVKSKLSTPQNDENTTGNRCRGSGIEVELTQISRARKCAPSSSGTTLTEGAVLRLGKQRKMGDLDTMVRRWAESTCGRMSEAAL